MSRDEVQKVEFRLERGGQYGQRGVSQQIHIEREVRARVYAAGFKSRLLQRIVWKETYPTRKLAKLHREAKRMKASYEDVRALFIEPLEEDLKRLYGRTLPPAA